MIEEQFRVISAVCKKLNADVEALETQINENGHLVSRVEHNLNEVQNANAHANKDLSFKFSRHDQVLGKIESDQLNMMSMMKDLQGQFLETQRALQIRLSDVEMRVSELNGRLDSILGEQNSVIKSVEGDTVKQLQLLDTKTRSVKLNTQRCAIQIF